MAASLSPIDLVSAYPWRRAVFTTYALSLSFFEAVVLDALVRGGGQERLILADVDGVRASLSELGACRVGKDYDLEPVAVARGVFHPKISVLSAEDECHLLVGSGNLSFGGWGGNFEVLEHLHPSFAADAVLDAAEFFDRLADATYIRHGAANHCHVIAAELRRAAQGRPRNGDIRLYHSLDGTISDKLAQAVDDLGGARRLVVASPFWDAGAAIDHLCEALGLDHVYVHAHFGDTVKGTAGANWPARTDIAVKAIRLDVMDEDHPRRLHAKAFEVICHRGRILLSGSANATMAALGANRNVEACVARIQRVPTVGWSFSAAEVPEFEEEQESQEEGEGSQHGILRAALEGDVIAGQVLTPTMSGDVSVFQITARGREMLGETLLSDRGKFQLSAPGLEVQSWTGGRLVLRVEAANGQAAEGYVSVSAYAELGRRLGALGPRIFAIIAGTETPADVAAIMSWFHEDPRRLGGQGPTGKRDQRMDGNAGQDAQTMILVGELKPGNSNLSRPLGGYDDEGSRWSRFMEHVLAAFREPRGPLGGTLSGRKGDDDDDDDRAVQSPVVDRAIERSLGAFDRLFDLLLSPANAPRLAITAFDLTQYICERLAPDPVKARAWLWRLVEALLASTLAPERRDAVAAAVLTQFGARPEAGAERSARGRLLNLRYDLSGPPPPADLVRGFQSVLPQIESFDALWECIQAVRTYPEQAFAYLRALKAGQPTNDYQELLTENPDERAVLEDAFRSATARANILVMRHWTDACPRCHRVLPTGERSKLHAKAVAKSKNCCGRVVVWPGD